MVQRPKFSVEEIEETKDTVRFEWQELERKWDVTLPERLHAVAYRTPEGTLNAMGRTTLCNEEDIEKMTPEVLHRFRSLWFTPNRMVIAGVGLDHAALESFAQQHFGKMPAASTEVKEYQKSLLQPAKYYGGSEFVDRTSHMDSLHPDDIPLTHIYLGFESMAMNDPDIYALHTLSSLFGGGGSFSAGGPGKGMYSRLYRQVLNRFYWIENCNNVNSTYSDTGLFALTFSVPPSKDAHANALAIMCDQLVQVAKNVTETELSRAKNQLKSQLLMDNESKVTHLENVAKQALHYDQIMDIKETCKRIDMVERQDIIRVARRIVFGEDIQSRFEFNDGVCRHWKRTGNGQSSLLVYGPLEKDDPIYQADRILKDWGVGLGRSKRPSRLSNVLNRLKM